MHHRELGRNLSDELINEGEWVALWLAHAVEPSREPIRTFTDLHSEDELWVECSKRWTGAAPLVPDQPHA